MITGERKDGCLIVLLKLSIYLLEKNKIMLVLMILVLSLGLLFLIKREFYWRGMSQEIREYILDCLVCQIEKGSHLLKGGKLMPLELPVRKWDYIALDFIMGMLACDSADLTVNSGV